MANGNGNGKVSNVLRAAALAVTAFVLLVAVVSSWAIAQYQISELRTDVSALKIQVMQDRTLMIRIEQDIQWIRRALEQEGRHP